MTSSQVALARAHRIPAPSNHISKTARQIVPAFLQKLYEMVNDPTNIELIRWSDAGDSFFVLDHERFAHEVLGKWFKHRNFSSFVRQLNMYGFHKIPHLQQGVLKSDTETEFWNFAHANFHRGQPDLLCLIQRKKPLPQSGEEPSIDLPGGITFGSALPPAGTAVGTMVNGVNGIAAAQNSNPTLSSGQILDIHSIANGITAIKRHQATISSELSELKRSNQLLWQDALAARGRQQKQQDTINRIVKFLAGVFGQHVNTGGGSSPGVAAGQHGKEDGIDGATGIGSGTRRKMMLMIEDAKMDGPKKSVIEELNEIPLDDPNMFDDTSYPSIETPVSAPSPFPSTPGDNPSPTPTTPGPELSTTNSTPQPQPQQPPQQEQVARAVTPSRSPTLPMFEFDPRNVLSQLSPAQFQQLLASLASQSLSDPTKTGTASPAVSTVNPIATDLKNTESNLTPYHQQPFDFSQATPNFGYPFIDPEALIPFGPYEPSPLTTTSPNKTGPNDLTLFNSASPQDREREERMAKEWDNAEIMEDNVNGLHSRIHSLAQALGLDPVLLDSDLGGRTVGAENDVEKNEGMNDLPMGLQGQQSNSSTTATGTTEALPSSSSPPPPSATTATATATSGAAPTGDFDFDFFFNNIGSSTTNGMGSDMDSGVDYPSTTFMDEVPMTASSSDQSASPLLSLKQDVTPEVSGGGGDTFSVAATAAGGGGPAKGTRKRKSEVDISESTTPVARMTTGGNKPKRRKDK